MVFFLNPSSSCLTFDHSLRYRFVWCRHTLNVYRMIRDQAEYSESDTEGPIEASTADDTMMEVIDRDDLGIEENDGEEAEEERKIMADAAAEEEEEEEEQTKTRPSKR